MKRVMYKIHEYDKLLDSSNIGKTNWNMIASDTMVSIVMVKLNIF